MKKLLILLVLPFLLISCDVLGNVTKEPYERMDKLEEPYEIELFNLVTTREIVHATYTLNLNEDQQVYYIPESYKYNGEVFVNKSFGYYLYDKNEVDLYDSGYTKIDEDTVKDLLDTYEE